jgi:hypothetical protein
MLASTETVSLKERIFNRLRPSGPSARRASPKPNRKSRILTRRLKSPAAQKAFPKLSPAPRPETDFEPETLTGKSIDSLAEKGIHLTSASVSNEATDFRNREERNNPVARLTVYALNAMIMLFAFPVGFALLIFNILGGENLRTTAHAMALTGMGIGLSYTDIGARLFGL